MFIVFDLLFIAHFLCLKLFLFLLLLYFIQITNIIRKKKLLFSFFLVSFILKIIVIVLNILSIDLT